MKILVVRTDRIGDVVLALPLAEVLHNHFPYAKIHFMLSETSSPLAENNPYIEKIVEYNNERITEYIRKLKEERYDIGILVHPTFPLSLILTLARIPQRIGTGYRWYSFLLNRRVYEHRQPSEKHEISYNLRLLRSLGIDEEIKLPTLYVKKEEKENVRGFLKRLNINPENFIVVHPGSRGSTLPWPEQNYRELVFLLEENTDHGIVLTGTKEEFSDNERIKSGNRGRVKNLAGMTNLRQLTVIISMAKMIISISTGPMHIASATKTPVVAFFSPSRVTRKTRWAPLTKSLILEPPVPHCQRCIREKCQFFNCMALIKPEEVCAKIQDWYKNDITK
jgi:heptosyltransferase-2